MTGAAAPDSPGTVPDGLIVLLPEAAGDAWRWWRVAGGVLDGERTFDPDAEAPWGPPDEGMRITALVPAALAPVQDRAMPAMPAAQALAAERLRVAGQGVTGQGGAGQGANAARRHAAVAVDGDRMLCAGVANADMDLWLGSLATAGLDPAALVPAALVLPRPPEGAVTGTLGAQALARTPDAAFAGEPALVEALAAGGAPLSFSAEALAEGLLAVHAAPPLNLRQGTYAPRRVSVFRLPVWSQLARMAATAALLALVLMIVWIVKWNADSASREDAALAAVQAKYPAATDIDTAERVLAAELARRGQGGASFAAPAAALLAAMQPVAGVQLRDLGYSADGTLRFTAASPRPEDINAVLIALQRDGWKVTVPPSLAPDPTGATVAAITLRAP